MEEARLFIQFATFWIFSLFCHMACGILVPQPGIKLVPAALEGEVLTMGLKQESPTFCLNVLYLYIFHSLEFTKPSKMHLIVFCFFFTSLF